jgi:hypothetical protein
MRALSQEPASVRHPDRVLLEVVGAHAYAEYKLLDTVQLGLVWELQYYLLEDSDRPIGVFIPGQVPALKHGSLPCTVWGRHRHPAGPEPWGLDLDDDCEDEPAAAELPDAAVEEHLFDLDGLDPDQPCDAGVNTYATFQLFKPLFVSVF